MKLRRIAFVDFVASMALRAYAQPANGDFKQTKEWKALNRYVGKWDNQATVTVPELKQVRQTPTAAWILGDRFVQMTEKAADGEMMYLLTYDQNRRAIRFWLFGSNGFTSTATGSWDEATSTLTLKADDQPPGASGTYTDRFTDDDHHEWRWLFKDAAGKVVFEASGKVTRLKNPTP